LFGLVNYKNPDYKNLSFNQAFDKHYNLGIINLEKGQFLEAILELKSASELNPYDYLSHFALGNAYYFNLEKERAIIEYKASLLINPLFIDAHFNLGNLYQDTGNLKEAEKEYKQVLSLSPDSLDAYYRLGVIYKSLKQYKQAVAYFKKILEYNPYYNSSIKLQIEECERMETRH